MLLKGTTTNYIDIYSLYEGHNLWQTLRVVSRHAVIFEANCCDVRAPCAHFTFAVCTHTLPSRELELPKKV